MLHEYEIRIPALMSVLIETHPNLHDRLRDDFADVFAVIDGDQDATAASLADCPYLLQRAGRLEALLPITPALLEADPTLTDAQKAQFYNELFEYTGDDED